MGDESCIKSGIQVRTPMIQDKEDNLSQNFEAKSKFDPKSLALAYYNGISKRSKIFNL